MLSVAGTFTDIEQAKFPIAIVAHCRNLWAQKSSFIKDEHYHTSTQTNFPQFSLIIKIPAPGMSSSAEVSPTFSH
jgi:hypothetical protein